MKPIKCWVTQDKDTWGYVFVWRKKPKLNDMGSFESDCAQGSFGTELKIKEESPIKCVIITEEEYNRLKGLENDSN